MARIIRESETGIDKDKLYMDSIEYIGNEFKFKSDSNMEIANTVEEAVYDKGMTSVEEVVSYTDKNITRMTSKAYWRKKALEIYKDPKEVKKLAEKLYKRFIGSSSAKKPSENDIREYYLVEFRHEGDENKVTGSRHVKSAVLYVPSMEECKEIAARYVKEGKIPYADNRWGKIEIWEDKDNPVKYGTITDLGRTARDLISIEGRESYDGRDIAVGLYLAGWISKDHLRMI